MGWALLLPFLSMAQNGVTGPIATFPYSTGFENADSNALWTFVNGSQTNKWYIGSVSGVNNTTGGSNGLFVGTNGSSLTYSNSSTSTVWVYTTFTFEAGEYFISFNWKCYGESGCDYLKTYVFPSSGSVSAGSTTVPSGAIQIGGTMNLSSAWQQEEGTFTITTPGNYKLAFLWRNDYSGGSTPPAVVDNIVIVKNTCPRPTNIHATAITSNSLGVEWAAGGTETSWEVNVSPSIITGEPPVLHNLTTPTVTLTGLDPNSDYTVSVRGICGEGDTSIATTATLRTSCVALTTLPYTMGFETEDGVTQTGGVTNTAFVDCWKRLNNATSYFGYPYVAQNSSNAHGGDRYLSWYLSTTTGSYGDYQVAVLPGVDTSLYSIDGLRLKFWAKTTSSSYTPNLYVGVMTDPADISTFVYVDTVEVAGDVDAGGSSNLWTEYMSDLTAYTGGGTYVAIRANRPTGSNITFYMDDITLARQPDCPRVANITATDIDSSSATITWTEIGSATSWEVTVSPNIFTGEPPVLPNQTITLTGLTAHTEYTVTITPVCPVEGSVSEGRSFKFTTACGFITSLPYTMGFETSDGVTSTGSFSSTAFIDCWHHLNNSETYFGYPFVTGTYNQYRTGSRGLSWMGTDNSDWGDYQCAILPGVNTTETPLNTLALRFWAKSSSTNYYPIIYCKSSQGC